MFDLSERSVKRGIEAHIIGWLLLEGGGENKNREAVMRCYSCARSDQATEAVAVCSVCGRGLCMDHSTERNLPLVRRVSGWGDRSLVHILCEDCSQMKALTD